MEGKRSCTTLVFTFACNSTNGPAAFDSVRWLQTHKGAPLDKKTAGFGSIKLILFMHDTVPIANHSWQRVLQGHLASID